jgi:hypothetical protein
MQTTSTSVRSGARGFALLVTMVFLGVVLLVFASVMYWASGNAKITERNNQYNMSSAAAEAAVERVAAQMESDFNHGSLTTADYYASLSINQSNWPIQYIFSDPTGAKTNGIRVYGATPATNSQPLGSQYGGLYGFAWNWTVSAKATPVLKRGFSDYAVPAIITETNNFASIPIFQFAIFYNINLEIDPGSPMTISGPVFCNKDMWTGSSSLTFKSTVAAVGHVNTTTTNPFAKNYTGSGTPTFSLAGQPTDNNPSLSMPIGTNNSPNAVQAMIALPPAPYTLGSSAAFSTNGQVYMANAADLYITNTAAGTNNLNPIGTNTFVYYQDGASASLQTLLTPDFYILRKAASTGFYTNYVTTNRLATVDCTTNVVFAGYSFITNALFYDWREGWNGGSGVLPGPKGKAVQAVQIDIAKFSIWLTNAIATNSGASVNATCVLHKQHPINSMYIYTSVPLTGSQLPAARLVNGIQLPSPNNSRRGFTLVTQFPAYVWGDYNAKDNTGSALNLYGTSTATLHTYPAAIMADSVTILSDSWSDSNINKSPTPTSTTINAAMLEGIVPSNPAISGNYSGGVENFLRLLENWGSSTLTYNGSIVVMYPSQYATNYWNGGYYGVPTRHWSFDFNYSLGQDYLPPLGPETKALVRVQWMAK